MPTRSLLIVWALLVSLVVSQSKLNFIWRACSVYEYNNDSWQPDPNPPNKLSTVCGTTKVPYRNNNVTSPTIDFFARKYHSETERKGTVIVIGDMVVGNSGGSVEWVGVKLYNTLNRTYDIILPDFRGTGFSTPISCPNPSQSWDNIAIENCQKKDTQYGNTYEGFSADEIAMDMLNLAFTVKNETYGQPLYLFGRGFGSYIVHRMLQMDGSLVDAVIMDGVCAGKYCNATEWDVQRDTMGKAMVSKLRDAGQSSQAFRQYSPYNQDVLRLHNSLQKRVAIGAPACGHLIQVSTGTITYPLFDQTIRPAYLAQILQLNRCAYYDYYNSIFAFNLVLQYADYMSPVRTDFLTTHIILSELIPDPNPRTGPLSYSLSVNELYLKLRPSWKTYAISPLRDGIASFNKPMLMMNGEYDPQTSNGYLFASNFNSTVQTFVTMPGMTHNSFMKSFLKNKNTTCGQALVAQFVACPTCQLNTSCTSDMVGLTFDGDMYTDMLFDNVWKNRYANPPASAIAVATAFSILLVAPVIIFILLIILRENRRVKSRYFAPHFGLLYIFVKCLNTIIASAGHNVSLPHEDLMTVIFDSCLVVSVTSILIQNVRFILLTHMYREMANRKSTQHIVKIIVSKILSTSIVLTFGAISLVFGSIMVGVEDIIGYNYSMKPFIIVTIVYIAVAAVLALFFFVFDMVEHWKIAKWDLRDYFLESDPLLFRVDSWLILPILVTGVVGNIIYSIGDGTGAGAALDFISLFLMLFYFGGNTVIACVVDRVRNRNFEIESNNHGKIDDEARVLIVIRNDQGFALLSKYCEKEFSLENLIAYKAFSAVLETVEYLPESELFLALQELDAQYLKRNAPMEVNLPGHITQHWNNLMKNQSSVQVAQEESLLGAPKKVISDICTALMTNVLDTFSRFKTTTEYLKWTRTQNTKNAISDALYEL